MSDISKTKKIMRKDFDILLKVVSEELSDLLNVDTKLARRDILRMYKERLKEIKRKEERKRVREYKKVIKQLGDLKKGPKIKLSERDVKKFLKTLNRPPKPNRALRKLFQDYTKKSVKREI